MNKERMGIGDKFFYYTSSGEKNSMNVRLYIDFKKDIDAALMEDCANEVLGIYPDLAVKLCLENQALAYCKNTKRLKIIPDIDKSVYFGRQTQGYLFCIKVKDRRMIISFYHGLTDFNGQSKFAKTLLELYLDKSRKQSDQEEYVIDPYERFSGENGGEEKIFEDTPVFRIPEDNYPEDIEYLSAYRLKIDFKNFDEVVKKSNASASSMVMSVFSKAIESLYTVPEDRCIRGMVAADLRNIYDCKTMRNFSDALLFPMYGKWKGEDTNQQAQLFKELLKKQMTKDNFNPFINDKVEIVNNFDSGEEDVATRVHRIEESTAKNNEPWITFALSYPGIFDLPTGCDEIIEDVFYDAFTNIQFSAGIIRFRDNLYIDIIQHFETDQIARKIAEVFEQIGITVEFSKIKNLYGDKLVYDKY